MESRMVLRIVAGTVVLALLVAGAAKADPVVDSFYTRCVSENVYQMQPGELEQACACMAPMVASFLTPEARARVEDAIRNNHAVNLGPNPYRGAPGDRAREAIRQCPATGVAMYNQKCAGDNATKPECQEMRTMIEQAQP